MNIPLYHHIARLARRVILVATVILFCYSSNVLAESTEVEELRLQVETLKKRVQELESAQTVSAPKITTQKATGNPWHALKVSMSKAEVTSLLGRPGKIDKWKTGEAWYFPNPEGGEIDFDVNGNVSGWLEP